MATQAQELAILRAAAKNFTRLRLQKYSPAALDHEVEMGLVRAKEGENNGFVLLVQPGEWVWDVTEQRFRRGGLDASSPIDGFIPSYGQALDEILAANVWLLAKE